MGKSQTEDKKPPKQVSAPVRSPKGALPKKQRGPTTTGTILVQTLTGDKNERYCPSKRVKAAHRKARKEGSKIPLKEFVQASSVLFGSVDWFANKKASGLG